MQRDSSNFSNLYILFLLFLVVGWYTIHVMRSEVFIRTDCLLERYYPWKNWAQRDISFGPCDVIEDIYPQKALSVGELFKKKVPLWNPYIFAGTPHMAASFNSVFSPFMLPFLIFPLPSAFGIATILALLLACLLMDLFLREIRCSPFASACGALLFGLSGFFINQPNEQCEVITALWLPLFLFALSRYHRRFQFRYIFLASFAIGLSLFGGMFEYLPLNLVFGSAYFIFLNRASFSKSGLLQNMTRAIFFLFLIVTLGFQLGAVQLLPSLELFRHGVRSILPFHVVQFVKPYTLIELLFPMEPFSSPALLQFEYNNLFIGLFPFTVILYLLLTYSTRTADRNPQVIFFLVATILVLVVAFGAPGFGYLYHFLLPTSRRAHRLLSLFHFSVATLTALGMTEIERETKGEGAPLRMKGIVSWTILGALSVMLFLVGFSHFLSSQSVRYRLADYFTVFYQKTFNPNVSLDVAVLKGMSILSEFSKRWNFLSHYSVDHWIPFSMGVIGVSLFWLYMKSRHEFLKKVLQLSLLVSLLIPPLHFINRGKQFGNLTMLFPSSESIEFLKKKGPPHSFRVIGLDRAFSNNLPMVFGLQTVGGYNPLFPKNVLKTMSLVEPLLDQSCREGYCGEISFSEKTTTLRSPILDMLNVRYIVAKESANLAQQGLKPIFQSKKDGIRIWENERALPRAFFVSRTVEAKGKELVFLQREDFDPTKLLILSEPLGENGFPLEEKKNNSSVEIISYEPEEVRLRVSNSKKGFLVLADAYYPGWKALCDGVETKIYRANYMLRAIRVLPGHHEVRFYYAPHSFKVGALLTMGYPLSLFLCYQLIQIYGKGRH